MRYVTGILILTIPVILADTFMGSIEYFSVKRVNFLCLLTCRKDKLFHHNFGKQASKQNIAVSSCEIDGIFVKHNTHKLDLCLRHTATATGVLINAKCPTFEEIMIYASENVLFDSKHQWLILEEKKYLKELTNKAKGFNENITNITEVVDDNAKTDPLEILKNLNLSINADITLSTRKDKATYDYLEVYNFGKIQNGRFVIEKIGEWDPNRGLNISKEFKYYRRWDFQQMAFRHAIVITPIPPNFHPGMVLDGIPDHRVSTITHTGATILHEITSVHNFRYNYTVFDRWVGDYVKEHKAVTNALYFKETDITPALRFLLDQFDRYDVTLTATSMLETRFYYRIPSHGIGKFENQFLRPLSTESWWGVVVICVLCGIVLLFSAIVENRPIDVYYSTFSVLALICQQFFEEFEDLRRISAARKMTILVTGLACLMIYNYYTSSVVSWLLNGPPPSINSLWELLDSPLQPVLEDIGSTYSWLELPDYYFNTKKAKAEDELKRRLKINQKKGKTIIMSTDEGINLVRSGGYAYHSETNTANKRISQTFNQRELCDLDSLHSMENIFIYPCLQKNSPYREFFSWSLARLQERGIINCVHERTWTRETKCGGSSPRALALGGAAPAFILLAAGFVLGTIFMLLERAWWKFFGKRRRSMQRNNGKNQWWKTP